MLREYYYASDSVLIARKSKINMTLSFSIDFKLTVLHYSLSQVHTKEELVRSSTNYYTAIKELLQLAYENINHRE